MRNPLIVSCLLLGLAGPAAAQLGVAISLPGVSIGINVPIYPELVQVPGYPVYYAPRLPGNYFFYDGMYWVLQDDDWYASSWYDGPWSRVSPQAVPLFVLRIPVRYFRSPPGYFRGWQADAPPRWGEHWGPDWQQRRSGWDRWDRQRVPAAAPLPTYQRQYPADRYPQAEQQQAIRSQNYRYQPREPVVRQHFQEPARQPAPQPMARPQPMPAPQPTAHPQPMPAQRAPQEAAPPQPSREARPPPVQEPKQRQAPAVEEPRKPAEPHAAARPSPPPQAERQKESPQGKPQAQEPKRGQGQADERRGGEDRGQERK